MKTRVLLLLLSCILMSVRATGQDHSLRDIPREIGPLPVKPLPTNIMLYDYDLPLLPAGATLLGLPGRMERAVEFLPDRAKWQKDYIRDNKLLGITANPTLVNGQVMQYAMEHKSQANMELYLTYMEMNRKAVGKTQLEMMQGGMKGIRHINFVGLAALAARYGISPEETRKLFDPRVGGTPSQN